jgi:hypothetical protein
MIHRPQLHPIVGAAGRRPRLGDCNCKQALTAALEAEGMGQNC